MASSGTLMINAKSVDAASSTQAACYPGITSGCCYGVCDPLLYQRGILQANITLNYTVDNSGTLSIAYGSTSYVGGTWCVCSQNGYHLDIDYSTDNVNWSTIMSSFANNWQTCPTCSGSAYHTVDKIASALVVGLVPVVLTKSGYIRARMWTQNACPTCGIGDDSRPHAFPNDAASIATAVPVHIIIDYRPGEVLTNGVWKSTNRSAGKCQLLTSGSWATMTTADAGSTGNPPSIRNNNTWKNQALIGDQT